MSKSISSLSLLSYGMLALPIAFAGIPIYIYAPDYYATEFGLSLTTLGLALLGLRLLDAFQDPLIGLLSDYNTTYRYWLMIVTAICLIVSFYVLFSPPTSHALFWFVAGIFCASLSFSILTINLGALGALWTEDKHLLTTIAGYREACAVLGLLLAIILPSFFQQVVDKQVAFFYLTCFLAIITGYALILFSGWYDTTHGKIKKKKPAADSRVIFSQFTCIVRRAWKFYSVYGISMFASAIPSILVLFFIRDVLKLESLTGLFLFLYFVSAASAMPLWQWLSKRFSKSKSWFFAMVLAIVSFSWAYMLQPGDVWAYAIICIASGMALGAELMLPASILADEIYKEQHEKHTTLYYGLLAFMAKIALAVAAAFSLIFLDYIGFQPAGDNSQSALYALTITYAAVPCVIKLVAACMLWKFSIGDNHGERFSSHKNNTTNNRSSYHV